MSWIEKIQQKPQKIKLRIITITLLVIVTILIVLWIFTSKIGKTGPADTTLFKKISEGFENIKENFRK